ncbi:MAG: 30S ribosomal protein S2 [Planctomycetota bacterium]
MPAVSIPELIEAGVHFGHQSKRWNPKMAPFIHSRRHKIHMIDLKATVRGLIQAEHFLRQIAAQGGQILFVGTKRQIRSVIEAEAGRAKMPSITERWIGGTLTNFNTVRERLGRLEELEAAEADGTMEKHKKKAQAMLRREMRKIQRNLEGLRHLHGLPAAMLVVDPRREDIALKEAARMNVPVVSILDTDCDPDLADIVVPGNDDAVSSVQLLVGRLTDAILEGVASVDEQTLAAARGRAKNDPRAREVIGRQTQQRGGPRRGGGGGRGGGRGGAGGRGGGGGGRSGGRFQERAQGHASTVSIGGDAAADQKAAEQKAGEQKAGEQKAGGAPAEAPKTDAPQNAAPETKAQETKAPEQSAPDTPPAAE